MKTEAREFLLKKCEKPTVDRDFNAIEAHPLKLCDPKDIEAERILKYIRVIEYSTYEKLQKRIAELEAENLRLVTELIDVQVEHPCYRLSKELEAENKKLREALKLSENKITRLDSTIDFYELNQWRSAVEDVMGDDCFFQALGEVGE